MGIYFLFGIFVSCFIILGFKSFYGKEKLILIFGWIIALLVSSLFFYIIGAYNRGLQQFIINKFLIALLLSSLFFYIIGASDRGIKLFIIKRLLLASCGYIKNIGFTNLAFSHVNTLEVCIKFKKFIKFPLNSPNHSPMPNRQCSLEGKFINKKTLDFIHQN